MTDLGEKIHVLAASGLGYAEIQVALGCSRSTISYYLNPKQKENTRNRKRKERMAKPILNKVEIFQKQDKNITTPINVTKNQRNKTADFQKESVASKFTVKEAMALIGEDPICYLTGRKIDLSKTNEYHFDHILPRSKGGGSDLDNLGLATREANLAKSDLTVTELLVLCTEILTHHGYSVKSPRQIPLVLK